MATFIQYASCYDNHRALQLLGLGRSNSISIFSYPPYITGPRQQLAYKGPDITMRHISQVVRCLRQLRARDRQEVKISRAPQPSNQDFPAASSSPIQNKGKRCVTCFRKHRSIKKVG